MHGVPVGDLRTAEHLPQRIHEETTKSASWRSFDSNFKSAEIKRITWQNSRPVLQY